MYFVINTNHQINYIAMVGNGIFDFFLNKKQNQKQSKTKKKKN